MTSKLILEWGTLFFILGIACYTLWSIKDEKIVFAGQPIIIFENFKIFVPTEWGEIQKYGENELYFSGRTEPWEARYIWNPEPEDIGLIDLFKKKISERQIVFDDSLSIQLNPSEFIHSPILQNDLFEIARLDGTSTVLRDDRHYCDVVLIRNKKNGSTLYAENKGPILNGFLEALSFEKSLVSIELI